MSCTTRRNKTFRKRMARIFREGKELESKLPQCPQCGAATTWFTYVPGIECRACGLRWGFALPSGRLYPIQEIEIKIDGWGVERQ